MNNSVKLRLSVYIQRTVFLFVTVFLSIFSFSQEQKTVHITSKEKLDFLKKTDFFYTDTLSYKKNCVKILNKAWKAGFWTFSFDSTFIDSLKTRHLIVSQGPKFSHISVELDKTANEQLNLAGISRKSISGEFSTFQLSQSLEASLKTFENNGYPFARLYFSRIEIQGNEISTQLVIDAGEQFIWDEIILKSENKVVNERYLSSLLNIRTGDLFSELDAQLVRERIVQTGFLEEIKPSELSFQNGKATLYLYLKSKRNSLFSGIIGLQQDPVKLKVGFTGELRLLLDNSFKRGESFQVYWRSVNPGSPQFNTQLTLPFLLNSPFGIFGQFQLVKRDTTFLETKPSFGVSFFLNNGSVIKAFYKNYQSSLLGNSNSITGFGSVKSNQYGINFTYQTLDFVPSPKKGIFWNLEGALGNRTVKPNNDSISKSMVYSFKTTVDYYIPIKKRFVIKMSVGIETFQTKNIQTNELLRFGGNSFQRGFLEDEFFATTRAIGTIEPRFILDETTYLFVFFDQTWYERNAKNYLNDQPLGFGAGFSFGTDVGIFSITYAIGKQLNNQVLLRDSKIHFGYAAYF